MEEYLRERYMAKWDVESPVKIKRFTRDRHLVKLFQYLGLTIGAEIGVYKGEYALFLCRRISPLKLFCIDPWILYDYNRANEGNIVELKPEDDFQESKQRLLSYNVTFLRMTSMEALKEIPDGSLDFVYIDANHYYKYIKEDLEEWSKKVKIGGIVSGHDYYPSPNCDVKQVVNEYVEKYEIKRWFLTGGDGSPSYFWENHGK
jgi:hypothetical protein